jgi:type I restriction enzyme, S subunit
MDGPNRNWPIVRTEEIAASEKGAIVSGPFGSAISSKYFVDNGTPVIRGNNLTLGVQRFVDSGFVFLGPEKTHEFRNMKAVAGDIVFTAAGTLGQVGIIPDHSLFSEYIISNKQLRLRVDRQKVDPYFAYYWYSSPGIRQKIIASNRGASVPLITLQVLRSLPIPLPKLELQWRIASILRAYDDLIENNTRRIAILEEMARRIFEEWFVHFRAPGSEGLPLIDSPLGPIPKGWEVSRLVALLNNTIGGTWGTEALSPDTEHAAYVIRGTDFPQILAGRYETVPRRFISTKHLQTRTLRDGDILIEVSGGSKDQPVGRTLLVDSATLSAFDQPVCFASFCRLMRPEQTKTSPLFLIQFLARQYTSREIMTYQKQSTGISNLRFSDFSERTVVAVPPQVVMQRYNKILEPVHRHMSLLRRQSANLRAQRDLLLPKLVSGEIDLSAAAPLRQEAAE